MAKGLLIVLVAAFLLSIGVILRQVFFISPATSPTPTAPTSPASPTSKAAGTPTNRIPWNGANWYLHGANVPWYNWGCDFGCNVTNGKTGGVSTNIPTLSAGFAQMKNAGMHVARWWVLPGDPAQIIRDASGTPTGIDPSVYTDFDAALQLAEQYDIY